MIQSIDLVKTFDDFTVLDHTNMHVPKGCVYGLVGPNGAGKSTLIRHITGIYKPNSGELLIDGEPIWENTHAKAQMAYIPDDIFYLGSASTYDMMKYYKGIYPNFDMERFQKLQEAFTNIDIKRPIRRLSKGMQKQSAFLLAMCISPSLLVLDEPVDGLDPVMRRQIWSLIMSDVTEHDTTVLVSSHNLRELEDVCDYVGIMDHGKIMLEHSLAELQGTICKVQIAFEGDMPALPENLNILHDSEMGRIHTLIVQASPNMAMKLLSPLNPLLLEPLPLSLEEIFIYELGGTGYECKDILFNRKIFTKNVKDALPILILMTGLLLIIGITCTNAASNSLLYGEHLETEKTLLAQHSFMDITSTAIVKVLFAAYSFFCGIFVFRYLYQKKLSSTIHALPLTRNSLFLTNALSGLALLILPLLLTAIILGIYNLIHGFGIAFLPLWMLVTIGFCLIFYALAVLTAMLTGHLVAAPVIYLILNFGILVIELIIRGMVSLFSFGLPGISDLGNSSTLILTPFVYLWQTLRIRPLYETGDSIKYASKGMYALAVYVIIALVILVIGLFLYKCRKLETQGDPVVTKKLEPVFSFFGTFVGSTLLTVILFTIITLNEDYAYLPQGKILLLIAIFLICSIVVYYVILMLLHKTLRVFRAHYKGLVLYFCLMFAGFLVIRTDIFGFESKTPNLADIRSVELCYMGNDLAVSEDASLEKILGLHKSIIENKEKLIESTQKYPSYSYLGSLEFTYQLKDGKTTFSRAYYIGYDLTDQPMGAPAQTLLKEFDKLMEDKALMLDNLEYSRNNLQELRIDSLNIIDGDDYTYMGFSIDERYYPTLIDAMKQDIKDGSLQYNRATASTTEIISDSRYIITSIAGKSNYRESYTEYLITEDCKNTFPLVQKLEELYGDENLLENTESYDEETPPADFNEMDED